MYMSASEIPDQRDKYIDIQILSKYIVHVQESIHTGWGPVHTLMGIS